VESESCWRRSFTVRRQLACPLGDNYLVRLGNAMMDFPRFSRQTLKLARVSRDVKTEISGWIKDGANMETFNGTVYRKESDYAWVTPSGQSRAIFLHCSNVNSEDWARMVLGGNVTFAIGFNYMGPAASMRHFA
jgi:cold shock CspA family protein